MYFQSGNPINLNKTFREYSSLYPSMADIFMFFIGFAVLDEIYLKPLCVGQKNYWTVKCYVYIAPRHIFCVLLCDPGRAY